MSVSNHYVHASAGLFSSSQPYLGRIGAVTSLSFSPTKAVSIGNFYKQDPERPALLAKKLAQHIVGLNPGSVDELLTQDYLMGGGNVKQVLDQFEEDHGAKVRVNDFKRLDIGENN